MAENDGELSFEPNQIITNGMKFVTNMNTLKVSFFLKIFDITKFKLFLLHSSILVRQSNEPGWLDGTLNGKSGLIPENYVEVLK